MAAQPVEVEALTVLALGRISKTSPSTVSRRGAGSVVKAFRFRPGEVTG